ncbi:MAG: ABC transporter ATP-binding protein [Clostridia bacterium]|nr:ABC transporter ATP-binding protein [Clostridia bacterium]
MENNSEENIIEIRNLVKEYKMFGRKKDRLLETIFPFMQRHSNFKAMDNLNLDIKKGEILGILGRNGAGKSTLLKMITGVVIPTSGTIVTKGKISSLLELGTAFNMELTGEENIYQHGEIFGLSKKEIEEKKPEIIAFADIGDHLYQPVKTYSSGMFARLAFACAINVDPDILIVDEVLSVGDMAFQLKCFKKFEEFKKEGKTIIFVTHSINDVLNNCNRAIIMNEGRKIFDGGVKEGVENYKKLITGMLKKEDLNKSKKTTNNKKEIKGLLGANDESVEWKKFFTINPDFIKYGNNDAEIIDFGMFNGKGEPTTFIDSSENITVKLKAIFHKNIECPTFSMTIKDFHGKEICGTNTNFLNEYTGNCKKGEKYICEFKQKFRLAPGKYTLSLSCSRFDYNGEIVVMDRNYDLLIFEVISSEKFVGYFNLESQAYFSKINQD